MKAKYFVCVVISLMTLSYKAVSQILYSESALVAGIDHAYGTGDPGCGVSFCDFNQDGFDDLTLGGVEGQGVSFYRNIGGTFEPVPLDVDIPYEIKQILWVDFDNDNDKDLYVACFDGYNFLFENTGNLVMKDITSEAGFPVDIHRGFGALWSDFNRDGWLDVYYVKRRTEDQITQNENRLFLNHPSGVFTEVTDAAGVADRGKKPFCAVAVDYDNDKWPDIYINNDKQTINTLLHNNGDGSFTDVSVESQANFQMDAMGTALGDYNNDGWLDMYVSNIPTGNVLLHNNGPDAFGVFTFSNRAAESNTSFNSVAWGTNFLDADNDGDLDLYVNSMLSGAGQINSTLYENLSDGTFRNLEGQLPEDTCMSFSNAIGDYNNDGVADIAVVNQGGFKTQLWGSHLSLIPNRFLKINLRGVLSNRDGVGTRIATYAGSHYQMRYTHCGIGFLGQNSSTEILGFGNAAVVDSIRITWPTGHIDMLKSIATDATLLIVEGSTTNGEINVDPDISIISGTEFPEKNEITNHFSVAPNPFREELKLKDITRGIYRIYDGMGNLCQSGVVEDSRIIMKDYPSGLYHFVILSDNTYYHGTGFKLE